MLYRIIERHFYELLVASTGVMAYKHYIEPLIQQNVHNMANALNQILNISF